MGSRARLVGAALASSSAIVAVVSVDDGLWCRVQHVFVREPAHHAPEWLEPASGAREVPQPVRFRWTAVPGAGAYRLQVGTAPGRRDLANSGRIRATSYEAPELPGGRLLHARVSARRNGAWHHSDMRLSARPSPATWIYPRPGQPDVDPARAFEWTRVPEAHAYHLTVGTSPGSSDLVDRQLGDATRVELEDLPTGRRLAASLRTRVGEGGYERAIDFAIGLGYEAARPLHPRPGGEADLRLPFAWTAPPMATGFRIRVGSAPGGSDLHDSGEIDVTRRFVAALPEGQRLYATLTTAYPSHSDDYSFDFYARPGRPSDENWVEAALAATADVRNMAGPTNHPWPRTLLGRIVRQRGHGGCVQYAEALLLALSQQGIHLRARLLNVCLLGNLYDCHTLVEMQLSSEDDWMLLDPTFAITVRRGDGTWASAADLVAAACEQNWSNLSFVALTEESLPRLKSYYIDYPLLFVSAFGPGSPSPDGGPAILRYYDQVALPLRDEPGVYAIQCAEGPTAVVLIDGRRVQVECSGRDSLSHIQTASSLVPLPGHEAEVRAFRPRRFVF